MAEVWFTALRAFGPWDEGWDAFRRWSGLTRLEELVTLDIVLCPPVLGAPTAGDWAHLVAQDYRLHLFRDLDYLVDRVGVRRGVHLLAVVLEPASANEVARHDADLARRGFAFRGYELLDVHGDVSALCDCGGFPLAFRPDEVGPAGLLDDLERAREVRRALRERYPDEPHAVCDLWAVWRLEAQAPGARRR